MINMKIENIKEHFLILLIGIITLSSLLLLGNSIVCIIHDRAIPTDIEVFFLSAIVGIIYIFLSLLIAFMLGAVTYVTGKLIYSLIINLIYKK